MLNRLRFMKVNNHKRFDYRPMYYDARREQLLKQVAQNKKLSENSEVALRQAAMKEQFARNKRMDSYQNQSLKSTIRLIIILGVILAAVYFLFQGMDDMVEVYKNTTK